jgi:hypothetical protein
MAFALKDWAWLCLCRATTRALLRLLRKGEEPGGDVLAARVQVCGIAPLLGGGSASDFDSLSLSLLPRSQSIPESRHGTLF